MHESKDEIATIPISSYEASTIIKLSIVAYALNVA